MIGLKLLTLKKNTAGEAPTVRILLKEKQNNCTVVQRTQEGETKQARKRGGREARALKKKQEQLPKKKRLAFNSKDTPSFFLETKDAPSKE